ncbi:uncharacterized protein LOC129241906 [Anastrepha obliqua]|uniref:uncharacterized protein LOC129241906 n=1 Tax=Anastrepha obliqua TaxID=95512 RepID=UPI0024093792|nr:uncharacterized protein LOC129241906 [Anastrepha obliqua]
MLSRNKLREILMKQHKVFRKSNVKPSKKSNGRGKSTNLKTQNEKVLVENIESNDTNAMELFGRRTPVEYFTLIEKDLHYIKPNEHTDYSKLDIFHRAVSPIIVIGQCFALLPVLGVRHANPRHLRFSFRSFQVLITLIFLIASSIFNLAIIKHLAKIGIDAKNLVGIMFFTCVQSSTILFFSLAYRWPRLIRLWTRTEMIFIRKPYEIPKCNLSTRVRRAAIAIISISAVEHSMYLISSGISQYRKAHICAAAQNTTFHFTFQEFTYRNYDYVYELLPNTRLVGGLILVVNLVCTFVWNYMDIFIMMISQGIAYRFEQIKMRINSLLDKEVPETVYMEIREHYIKLIELLEYVDEDMSGIILLSCANNLYFVCYQLLNIFNKLRWPINYVYFWFSLLFLIGRTAFVFITAASINDQAKDALGVLRRVPARTWCVEVERLIFQMATTTVALSGKKFYFLTRRLLFGMAGTIVTYELVLLQFDEPNRSKGLPDLCTFNWLHPQSIVLKLSSEPPPACHVHICDYILRSKLKLLPVIVAFTFLYSVRERVPVKAGMSQQLQDQTFHKCVSKVLFISQFFGLLPVSNLTAADVQRVHYNWCSVRTLYSAVVILLNFTEFGTVIFAVFKAGISFHYSGTISLFVVCLLEHIYFWRLATKWPFIIREWRRTEEIFLRTPYRIYATYNMKARIYALSFMVMCSALVEHCFLVFNSFHKSNLERIQCKFNVSFWESLYRRERPHLSKFLPFNIWYLPVMEWINLTLAYPRSFTDAFIICVSIGLAARFHQLHLRIEAVHNKTLPTLFWTEVREHFLELLHLMKLVNDNIAPLILLACSNNMYFICFQLFNSFQNIGVDLIAVIAFWYSLFFAISRTALTLFIASSINDYGKRILVTLRSVPSTSWCAEAQRFSEQLAFDLTAWSGCGFFYITRQLILAMASTIFTYEVMVSDVINKGSIQQITNYCKQIEYEHENE